MLFHGQREFPPRGLRVTPVDYEVAFHQLQSMFPLEANIIHAVLKVNRGDLDASVNDMLAMCAAEETARARNSSNQTARAAATAAGSAQQGAVAGTGGTTRQMSMTLPPPASAAATGARSSSAALPPSVAPNNNQILTNNDELPPPYEQAVSMMMTMNTIQTATACCPHSNRFHHCHENATSVRRNETVSSQQHSVSIPSQQQQASTHQRSSCSHPHHPHCVNRSKSSRIAFWNPPLLGNLPKDFLRLPGFTISAGSTASSTPAAAVVVVDCPTHRRSSLQNSASASSPAVIGISSVPASTTTSTPRLHHSQSARQAPVGNVHLSHPHTHHHHHHHCSQHQHSLSHQPPFHDQRIVQMINNEEFLKLLREDEEFMHALRIDHEINREHRRQLAQQQQQHQQDQMSSVTLYPMDNERSSSPFPNLDELEHPDHLTAGRYGEYGDQLDSKADSNEDLRAQLNSMGRFSAKKFSTLARSFVSMRSYRRKPSYMPLDQQRGGGGGRIRLDEEVNDLVDEVT